MFDLSNWFPLAFVSIDKYNEVSKELCGLRRVVERDGQTLAAMDDKVVKAKANEHLAREELEIAKRGIDSLRDELNLSYEKQGAAHHSIKLVQSALDDAYVEIVKLKSELKACRGGSND